MDVATLQRTRTVVVIDDSVDDFEVLARVYGRIDPAIELVHFATGELFLPAVQRGELALPAYVLLDLNLPGSSGIAILRQLKTEPNWGCVPTVVLSGSARPADVRAAYAAGANAYVVKTLDPSPYLERFGLLHRFWTDVVELAPATNPGRTR